MGTRISVSLVGEWFASGATREQILAKYKQLTVAVIEQAIAVANSETEGPSAESAALLNEIDTLDDDALSKKLKRRSEDRDGAVSWDVIKAESLRELE